MKRRNPMTRKIFFLLVSLITLTIAAAYYTEASAAQAVHEVTAERSEQNNLSPFVDVTDYGNVHRQQFHVTGSIPLPKGALTEENLSNIALFSPDKEQVPVQFAVIGRWLDGSVKWLLLDFQSTQDAGSTARYTLQFSGQTLEELSPLASKKGSILLPPYTLSLSDSGYSTFAPTIGGFIAFISSFQRAIGLPRAFCS